jgi:hypothetical protein
VNYPRLTSIMRSIKITGLSLILGTILVATPIVSADSISVGGPSDCDDNAIIKCGAHTTSDLVNAYQASEYVHQVYASFGISSAYMGTLSTNNVVGRVTDQGNVYIDGRSTPIATGAMTAGRLDMPGSTKTVIEGSIFYKRPPSVSFKEQSLPAFVSMSNGVFRFAILASCGNPVSASAVITPTAPAAVAPTPQPAPAPVVPAVQQTQTQSQQVIVNTPAAPTPAPVTQTAAPTPQPVAAVLPNTGPMTVAAGVGIFLAICSAGYFGSQWYMSRRQLL